MIKFSMQNPKVWKTCVSAVSTLVQEAAFAVSPDGLKLRAMDPSHVALVDLDLPAKTFDDFKVEKPTIIGVNLVEMNKIVSRAKPSDKLTLEFDEHTNRLTLILGTPPKRRFSMPVIDVRTEDSPEPKIAFSAVAKVMTENFQDGIRDAELIDDTVKIEASESGIRMWAESDHGSSEFILDTGSEALPELSVNPGGQSAYQAKYLADITKNCSPTDVIEIKLGNDLPIQIDYPIAEGRLRFLLAPRVEAK